MGAIYFITILFIVIALVACYLYDDKDKTIMRFRAILEGSSQVPPVMTDARGSATLKFSPSTKKFTLVVEYNGLTPTAAHIHRGAMGVNGPIVFPLIVGPSPMKYTSRALVPEEIEDLKNGNYYVNIHTEANPGGEIRGQIIH